MVFVRFFGSVEFLCWSESMGAQFSKTAAKGETAVEKPGEAAASPTKTNGQVIDLIYIFVSELKEI